MGCAPRHAKARKTWYEIKSGALLVSPQTLIRLFVILTYGLLCLTACRLILSRLTPAAQRLAILMLLAQIIVIAVSIEFRAEWGLDDCLWDLNRDWNIPSVVASTQLALVAGAALLAASFARAHTAWLRLYLVAIGLAFLFMARDEYAALHEAILGWERYYALLGAAIVIATLLLARRAPPGARIWHLCLLAGLALSAIGGIGIEQLRPQLRGPVCDALGALRLDGCLLTFQYEETLECGGMWLVLLAMLGHFSDIASSADSRARRLLYFMPALWILWLISDPSIHRQFLVRPNAVLFEAGVELREFRVEIGDGEVALELDASARRSEGARLGYSAHLVDQARGNSGAGRDARWCCQQSASGDTLFFRQRLEVDYPPDAPANRALWIVLTVWRDADGEFEGLRVLAGELQLLSETQLVLGELVIPAPSAPSSTSPLAAFDNGFALSAADIPARALPGETLPVAFTWRSDRPGGEDLTQFLHFAREESGAQWGYDQPPLGQRLPTRLWYSGLAESETWPVPLPADLAPGRYAIYTGLYRARDLQRIAASDAAGQPWRDARVLLGHFRVD